jgi:hypothetical protein
MWIAEDGREVEVSAVYRDQTGEKYLWPDKVFVGPVKAYSRPGRPAKKGWN